jgi:hypothetical protein
MMHTALGVFIDRAKQDDDPNKWEAQDMPEKLDLFARQMHLYGEIINQLFGDTAPRRGAWPHEVADAKFRIWAKVIADANLQLSQARKELLEGKDAAWDIVKAVRNQLGAHFDIEVIRSGLDRWQEQPPDQKAHAFYTGLTEGDDADHIFPLSQEIIGSFLCGLGTEDQYFDRMDKLIPPLHNYLKMLIADRIMALQKSGELELIEGEMHADIGLWHPDHYKRMIRDMTS